MSKEKTVKDATLAKRFPEGKRVKVHSGDWGAGNLGAVKGIKEGRDDIRLVQLDAQPAPADPIAFHINALTAA